MTTREHAQVHKEEGIDIAVVTFDVSFDPLESGLSAEEVLIQLFSYSPPIRLRGDTNVQYLCGNYQLSAGGIWVGEIELQRRSKKTTFRVDEKRGNVFLPSADEGEPVTTLEDRSWYAFDPKNNVIAYRDRAAIPYTRLRSFVQSAAYEYKSARFKIDLRPREEKMKLSKMINGFTKISSVSLRYRHSQSPGNAFIDRIVENLNANEIKESVVAKPGTSLNKKNLVGGDSMISNAIDHIDKNEKNGGGKVRGHFGEDLLTVDSKKPVRRDLIKSNTTAKGIFVALVDFLRKLANRQNVAQ